MKAQTLFVFASALVGVLAAPIQEREAKVMTIYENVVHVVTSTSTVWVKPTPKPAPVADEEKGKDDEDEDFKPSPPKTTDTPAPKPEPVAPAPKPEPVKPTPAPEPLKPAPAPEPEKTPKEVAKPSDDEPSSGGNQGEATYYNTGLGSCGIPNTDDELVVAISHELMDEKNTGNSNNNPLCGKMIKCSRDGKSVTVKVVDRCPGCDRYTLDLSPAAFDRIAQRSAGRVPITWEWL